MFCHRTFARHLRTYIEHLSTSDQLLYIQPSCNRPVSYRVKSGQITNRSDFTMFPIAKAIRDGRNLLAEEVIYDAFDHLSSYWEWTTTTTHRNAFRFLMEHFIVRSQDETKHLSLAEKLDVSRIKAMELSFMDEYGVEIWPRIDDNARSQVADLVAKYTEGIIRSGGLRQSLPHSNPNVLLQVLMTPRTLRANSISRLHQEKALSCTSSTRHSRAVAIIKKLQAFKDHVASNDHELTSAGSKDIAPWKAYDVNPELDARHDMRIERRKVREMKSEEIIRRAKAPLVESQDEGDENRFLRFSANLDSFPRRIKKREIDEREGAIRRNCCASGNPGKSTEDEGCEERQEKANDGENDGISNLEQDEGDGSREIVEKLANLEVEDERRGDGSVVSSQDDMSNGGDSSAELSANDCEFSEGCRLCAICHGEFPDIYALAFHQEKDHV